MGKMETIIERYKLISAILALGLLVFLYFIPTNNKLLQLLHEIIPSAIVVLISIPIAYYLFFKEKYINESYVAEFF